MEADKLVFSQKNEGGFYTVVRERVNAYFTTKNLSKNANAFMILKTAAILFLFALTYGLMISNAFSPWILLSLAALNGFLTALIGLNIGHDAIHGSYTSNPKINRLLSLSFNMVGASSYMWRRMHNIIHHTYTNIPGHDDDINQIGLLRINPEKKRRWIHRFQHIYAFLFYPLATLSWVFIKDYVKFFSPFIGEFDNRSHEISAYIRLFAFKAIYYTFFLVIPLIVIPLPWYAILTGFVVLHFVEGMTLSIIFQLAHVVEGPVFPAPDEKGEIDQTWAAHQMYTTANFACRSRTAYVLFGGLNFQIEHHLFPKICHVHYQALAPIVRETAAEFNLPYHENETFWGAIGSHVRMLKRLGREDSIN